MGRRKRQKLGLEQKKKIRRVRKARRLYKKRPLFAVEEIKNDFPTYHRLQFFEDIKQKTPAKKRRGRSGLRAYGRYDRMQSLIWEYEITKDVSFLVKAQQLRNYMTQPYRLKVRIGKKVIEYEYSPYIQYASMEEFAKRAALAKTWDEFDEMHKAFVDSPWIGR